VAGIQFEDISLNVVINQ